MTEDGMESLRAHIKAELAELFGAEPSDEMYRVALGAAYPLVFPEKCSELEYRLSLRAVRRE